MNRRQLMMSSAMALAARRISAQTQQPAAQDSPETFLLKDYHPRSIYRVPKADIKRAKYPIVDVHCHGARPIGQLDEMVKVMDGVGVEKTVIFTGANSADRLTETRQIYSKYPNRFDLWCSFDLTGNDQPGFGPSAVKALEDCHRAGAAGVGEISDKGFGFRSGGGFRGGGPGAGKAPRGSSTPPATPGPHADDPRMDSLWDKCAQLGMPVNIHVSDPIWSYQPMDLHNDGLMNGYTWRIDDKQPGILGHNGLIESLERATQKHRKTVFIACHLANLDYDLTRLGQMFERNPNLYADISARFAETAPIPRFVNQFFQKYPDRVLYGTDMAYTQRMFSATFRILESQDEHFYEQDLNFNFNYHWPLYGLGLPDSVLKKVYRDNALRAFRQAQ
jgi:predicted TIM-barrel fold metal-dependent hydrolase